MGTQDGGDRRTGHSGRLEITLAIALVYYPLDDGSLGGVTVHLLNSEDGSSSSFCSELSHSGA